LLLFCASFVYFAGPHGPAGPMFVLWVINKPVAALGARMFPFEDTPVAFGPVLAIVEITINGALYGAVAAVLVALWRAVRGRRTP
jgi:hypothetical protein